MAGNLYIQIQILQKMPPFFGELRAAKAEVRRQLLLKQPIIRVTIDEPLRVEVGNVPLQVENW